MWNGNLGTEVKSVKWRVSVPNSSPRLFEDSTENSGSSTASSDRGSATHVFDCSSSKAPPFPPMHCAADLSDGHSPV
jgi:hypothetical protein